MKRWNLFRILSTVPCTSFVWHYKCPHLPLIIRYRIKKIKKQFNSINTINNLTVLQGHPFMENLRENKLLMYAIMASSSVVVLLTLGLSSELNSTFQIIYFPEEVIPIYKLNEHFITLFFLQFQKTLIYVLLADTSLAYIVDRLCSFVFNSIRSKSDLTNY